MLRNPFKFGREVSGKEFYDRNEVFARLYAKLAGGSSNVVMYAPRRYGKTSLVKKVLARFKEEGVPTVYFDMARADTLARFCDDYASALYSIAGRGREIAHALSDYLAHLHPTFSFGGDLPVAVRLDYGEKMSATSVSAGLDLAEKVAAECVKGPLVVAFDEFQEIGALSPQLPLEGIFRGAIQAHQHVRYVFLGSKTHLVKRMFGEKSRPFYKSAATIRLDKPAADECAAFVAERFAAGGIGIDATEVAAILSHSENIPYYLQELSSQVFESVCGAGRDWVEKTDVERAVKCLTVDNADYYAERVRELSPTRRTLLRALAEEPTSIFTDEYRRRHSLGCPSTVHTALRQLQEEGIVESDAKGWRVGDPFFARYVREPGVEV